MMDQEEYQRLLWEEQLEIATSVSLEGAVKAIQAQNEVALTQLSRVEQEVASVSSELETLSRFKSLEEERIFTVKAESYKLSGDRQKIELMFYDIEQSVGYWKTIDKKEAENIKTLDIQLSDLYESPWIGEHRVLREEVDKMKNDLEELLQEYDALQNAKTCKSPNNNLDNHTVEMFRNMIRNELRLTPGRAVEAAPPRLEPDLGQAHPANVEHDVSNDVTPLQFQQSPSPPRQQSTPRSRPETLLRPQTSRHDHQTSENNLFDDISDNDTPTQSQQSESPPRQQSTPRNRPETAFRPQPSRHAHHTSENNLFDDISDNDTPMQSQQSASPPRQQSTPRSRPETPPRPQAGEQDSFNDFQPDANHVDITAGDEENGHDFFNLLGENQGSNDTPMFSFLQEPTNNSDGGANNFFFNSSPQARKDKDESSHGFFF